MANNKANSQDLSPYQKEQLAAAKKIGEYKKKAEAAVTSLIYKAPDVITECDLTINDFSNNIFKVYFAIANDLIKEKIDLTDVNVGIYLEQHQNLRKKYEEYGGIQTMLDAGEYLNLSSLSGYIEELKKWNAVLELLKNGFPVSQKLSEYADMTAEEIYEEAEGMLNHIFANVDSKVKSYDALTGLNELIDELNEGNQVGMPFGSEMINKEFGGFKNGNIYALTAASGAGKSTLAINYILPQCIKYKRQVVCFINEEDIGRWRQELLVWCCTNVLKKPIQKVKLRDGKFDKDTLQTLRDAADWLQKAENEHLITVIPLEHYTVGLVIKLIKKYNRLFGIDLFILDTFKESSDSQKEAWKSMMEDSVALYDTIKPAVLNVTLFMTMQISKGAMRTRHLTNMDIGQSKSVVDVFSVSMLVRKLEPDEFDGEKHALKVYEQIGKSRVPKTLDPDKHYLIFFIAKNRFGSSDRESIVIEFDLSTNSYKDIGYTMVPNDTW